MSKEDPKFNVGDIISFSRGLYHHWGVYYGQEDGKNYVVSVSGESNSKPLAITSKLVKEELNKVAGKSEYSVYRELDKHNEPRSPEQMKADMDKMIGTKIKYDPFEKNCQHFATKIRYGKEISPEGESAAKSVGKNLTIFSTEMDPSGFGTEKFNK
ncbi:phospholipase A and acyltransferase 4-like isoform X2 [Polyodon spathula]|uniref:phospholipase A and acyltransferase 4-like isoform X2 n=1 Tax=Polyodon spathula TaxID=7913 RepID=UPI001B7F3C5B|nr:phospholipase A and acyltransferase 4-like isoform X2 [Polyodon spathula]